MTKVEIWLAISDPKSIVGIAWAYRFDEFLVGLYNYCTMDKGTLVKFAFDLFDVDGSGEIDHLELKVSHAVSLTRHAA